MRRAAPRAACRRRRRLAASRTALALAALLALTGLAGCVAAPNPLAIAQPTAVAGVRSVTVSWHRPTGAAARYQVRTIGLRSTSCAKSPCVISSLAAGTRYAFQVSAISPTGALGPWSAASRTVIPTSPPAIPPPVLSSGQTLTAGHQLRSPDGRYTLIVQGDGNVVVYGTAGATWSTGTGGTGSGNYLVMQADGNLVVYKHGNVALWWSGTAPGYGLRLQLQDDGNLVVYSPGGWPVWDYGSGRLGSEDNLGTGQTLGTEQVLYSVDGRYGAKMQADGNLVVYGPTSALWSTVTGGTGSGNYLIMQGDGNLVVYKPGNHAVWSSSTAPSSNDHLVMQTDGNLVIYSGGSALWSSNTGLISGVTAVESAAMSWARTNSDGHDTSYNEICLTFVFNAYTAAGVNLRPWVNVAIGSNTFPVDIWGHFTQGHTGSGTPPAGALVFWASATGDRTLSHVALSLGGGNLVSSSDAVSDNTHYETMTQHGYAKYLGWWLPDR